MQEQLLKIPMPAELRQRMLDEWRSSVASVYGNDVVQLRMSLGPHAGPIPLPEVKAGAPPPLAAPAKSVSSSSHNAKSDNGVTGMEGVQSTRVKQEKGGKHAFDLTTD